MALRQNPIAGLHKVFVGLKGTDQAQIVTVLLLIFFGVLISLSTSPVAAARYELSGEPFYFFERQLLFSMVGIGIFLSVLCLSTDWARRFCLILYVIGFVALLGLAVFGHEAGGAQRWYKIGGFSLQPSEFMKPVIIVVSAWFLAERHKTPEMPWTLIAFLAFALPSMLILLQPDVGQTALIAMAFLAMFFVSGLPLQWGLAFTAGGGFLAGLLYFTLPHVRARIAGFFNPAAHDTYQTDKALAAFQNGGVLGAGPGEGTMKFQLPDAHTDFVLSATGEEFGLIGVLGLLIIYSVLLYRGLLSASRTYDPFTRSASAGLYALFGFQILINAAVNLHLLPPKGMTLPFISYGGSSMLAMSFTLALAIMMTRQKQTITKSADHSPDIAKSYESYVG